ncbi:MAG: MBL fold metallo-hydrolase [Propionibacteriales bacterium]|nr:MBL fold metallo-hydrolase [Propionibacteriales bacterium]
MTQLRFLGSGDAFGSGGRLQACLHLPTPDGGVLLDCGATSLVAMKQAEIDPSGIGWVLLTHLHGDHFGGLPFLVLDGQFSRRERPLVVAGPPGTRDRLDAAMEVFYPGSTKVQRRFDVQVVELPGLTARQVGPVRVTAYPVDHASGAPAYALRVEYDGKVVAYSGDTAWTDSLVDAAHDADLLVCEAYFHERDVKFHLSHHRLLAERHRLSCRRIVLTHMSSEMLAHAAESEFECAYDGAVIEI